MGKNISYTCDFCGSRPKLEEYYHNYVLDTIKVTYE